jgi:hypothetical protein
MTMVTLITALVAAGAVGPLALRFGVDSRPGFDERPERLQDHRRII